MTKIINTFKSTVGTTGINNHLFTKYLIIPNSGVPILFFKNAQSKTFMYDAKKITKTHSNSSLS